MKRYDLLTTLLLSFALIAPISACGDDEADTSSTTEMGDGDGDGDATTETGSQMDINCATFCVQYIDSCLGTEFETDAECQEACGMWDQAGKNCRYEQMVGGSCDEAGTMGSAC